jgi:hypothetical protein
MGTWYEISWGSDITFTGNHIDNRDGDTDMYISAENSAYDTQNVSGITILGPPFQPSGRDQGNLLVWAQGSTQSISGFRLRGTNSTIRKTKQLSWRGAYGEVDQQQHFTSH